MMQQVADTDAALQVNSASPGTGKEVVARNLHTSSSPAPRGVPVPVNCGAIPGGTAGTNCSATRKGAFTGAITNAPDAGSWPTAAPCSSTDRRRAPLPMQVKRAAGAHLRKGRQQQDAERRRADHRRDPQELENSRSRTALSAKTSTTARTHSPSKKCCASGYISPCCSTNSTSRDGNYEKRGPIRFNSRRPSASLCRQHHPGRQRPRTGEPGGAPVDHDPRRVIGVGEPPKKFRHVDDEDEITWPAACAKSWKSGSKTATPAAPKWTPAMLPAEGLDLKDYLANPGLIQQALDDAGGVVARAAERLRIRRTTLVEKMRKYRHERKHRDDLSDD